MTSSYTLFLIFLFSSAVLYPQQVQLRDAETGQPLPGVAVFTDDRSVGVISDRDGKVLLDVFPESVPIHFQHTAYQRVTLTRRQAAERGNVVLMEAEASRLEGVVLSVTGFAQEKRDAQQRVLSISPEETKFTNPQTTADLLENSGQVFVQKSQQGGGSPMIRGFAANRLLISVDGVRMNTAIFRGGNLQNVISIDPFAVENTEVILGPGSVIYGSDAIGGVMSFRTLQPRLFSQDSTAFSGGATTRFASANSEKTGHVHFNLGPPAGRWAFLTSASYNIFEDLRMGSRGPDEYLRHRYAGVQNGEDVILPNPNPKGQTPTGYDQLSLIQKIRYVPDDHWDLDLGLIYSTTTDYDRYDRLTRLKNDSLRFAEWRYGPQRWFSGSLRAGYENEEHALFDRARLTSAYQRFEESRTTRNFGSDDRYLNSEAVDAWSVAADFNADTTPGRLFYGTEYVLNRITSAGTYTDIHSSDIQPAMTRYPDDATWQSAAAYASLHCRWNDFRFQSGLRYSHVFIDADPDTPFYDIEFGNINLNMGNLTGSAGLTWQQHPKLRWRANIGTAFRAPNIDDIAKVFDSEPGWVVIPNPGLKSEYAYNGELGVNIDLDKKARLELSTYYTWLHNALVRRDYSLNDMTEIDYQGEPSRIQAIQNASDARVYGLEAGLEVSLTQNLKLISQYSITDGYEEREDGAKAPLRHAPPQFGNTRMAWERNRLKIDAYAAYSGGFRFDQLAPTETLKTEIYAIDREGNPYSPSWHTLNLASRYRISDHWTGNIALENITDQRYRTYSSGISAPGRNLILAVSYVF